MIEKKGFTLVELMAVLVLLGVILLMAMPSITNTFRNSKELEEDEYINTVCLGAQSYMNLEKDANGNKYEYPKALKIEEDLKGKGYLRENLKVPEESESFKCVRITANKACTLVPSCG